MGTIAAAVHFVVSDYSPNCLPVLHSLHLSCSVCLMTGLSLLLLFYIYSLSIASCFGNYILNPYAFVLGFWLVVSCPYFLDANVISNHSKEKK